MDEPYSPLRAKREKDGHAHPSIVPSLYLQYTDVYSQVSFPVPGVPISPEGMAEEPTHQLLPVSLSAADRELGI